MKNAKVKMAGLRPPIFHFAFCSCPFGVNLTDAVLRPRSEEETFEVRIMLFEAMLFEVSSR